MLKIKDEVDLKELEKFGYYEGIDDCGYKSYIKDLGYGDYIAIDKSNNNITLYVEDQMVRDEEFSEIKDLIQAGLIEKVEG